MEIKSLYNTKLKKAILIPTAIATIVGTYGGNEGGLTPLYNKKVGLSGGINIGLVTYFTPGSEFYGGNFSFVTFNRGIVNGGEFSVFKIGNGEVVNGGEFSVFKESIGTVNGIDCNVLNLSDKGEVNGLEISIANLAEKIDAPLEDYNVVNGWQIGLLMNRAKAGNCFQTGIYNEIRKPDGKVKRGLGLNYHFKGKSRK